MQQGKKPRGREKRVTGGTGLHKTERTASVSTGPVNNTGNYAGRPNEMDDESVGKEEEDATGE